MKLNLKTANKSHRVLLFGPPKAGKSYLAGKLAEKFNIVWIDFENGYDTLFQLPKEWQERIEIIALPDTRAYPIAIETALKVIKGGPCDICETHGKVSCAVCRKEGGAFVSLCLGTLPLDTIVVFDSLTQLTNSVIANVTKNQPDDYKLEFNDWANVGKLMDMFLSQVQQAPFHVVCISHETEVEMEDGKNKLVPTAGTRNFSRNTAKYFDEVIYCEVKNKRHVAASSTLYNGNILTGSRTGSVLESQAEASLIPIFKGEIITAPSIVHTNTSATAALSGLAALKAKLEADKQKGISK